MILPQRLKQNVTNKEEGKFLPWVDRSSSPLRCSTVSRGSDKDVCTRLHSMLYIRVSISRTTGRSKHETTFSDDTAMKEVGSDVYAGHDPSLCSAWRHVCLLVRVDSRVRPSFLLPRVQRNLSFLLSLRLFSGQTAVCILPNSLLLSCAPGAGPAQALRSCLLSALQQQQRVARVVPRGSRYTRIQISFFRSEHFKLKAKLEWNYF